MDEFALIACCAHPDDAELIAGGTLRAAVERGQRVGIVDLCAGECATKGTVEIRAREAIAAARILGVAHRECLGLPDGGLVLEAGHKDRVVEALRRLRPRIVITHHGEHRHPDHEIASELVRTAAFLAGLANYRPDLGRAFRPQRIYHALSTLKHDATPPNVVVDVSRQWAVKLDAVRAHESQFPPLPYAVAGSLADALRQIEIAARWHGRSIGVEFGEAFVTAMPLPVDDLTRVPANG